MWQDGQLVDYGSNLGGKDFSVKTSFAVVKKVYHVLLLLYNLWTTKHQKVEDNEDTEDGNNFLNVLVSHDMKWDYWKSRSFYLDNN